MLNIFTSFAEEQEEDDTPKPDFKPPPVIPKEDNRTGTNKKTFFVCNERKSLWILTNERSFNFCYFRPVPLA